MLQRQGQWRQQQQHTSERGGRSCGAGQQPGASCCEPQLTRTATFRACQLEVLPPSGAPRAAATRGRAARQASIKPFTWPGINQITCGATLLHSAKLFV